MVLAPGSRSRLAIGVSPDGYNGRAIHAGVPFAAHVVTDVKQTGVVVENLRASKAQAIRDGCQREVTVNVSAVVPYVFLRRLGFVVR